MFNPSIQNNNFSHYPLIKKDSARKTIEQCINNEVILRVWSMCSKNTSGPLMRIGHTSLQTEQHYISYWPDKENEIKKTGVFSPQRPRKLNTLEEDIAIKGSDYRIYKFYSLNVDRVNTEFRQLEALHQDWNLYASAFFKRKNTLNCVELCTYLLQKSGFNALIKNCYSLSTKKASKLAVRNRLRAQFSFLCTFSILYEFLPPLPHHFFLQALGGVIVASFSLLGVMALEGHAVFFRPGALGDLAQFAMEQEKMLYDLTLASF